jgi:hypothetical protein
MKLVLVSVRLFPDISSPNFVISSESGFGVKSLSLNSTIFHGSLLLPPSFFLKTKKYLHRHRVIEVYLFCESWSTETQKEPEKQAVCYTYNSATGDATGNQRLRIETCNVIIVVGSPSWRNISLVAVPFPLAVLFDNRGPSCAS